MNGYPKYKPSGIDWIGDVPKDWEVKKLKHILLGVNSGEGISNNEIEEDGEFEIYGGNGVMAYTNKYNSEGKVIVIGRVGAKCGVTYLLDKKVWISDNALQTRTYQDYKYLYYLLDAIDFNQYANQNAQPLITGTIVKNFPIPFLKNKEEQLTISNYLDQQTQKIDRLIANKKAQAEKLKELRQIEINNAVTKGLNSNAELKDSGIDWLGKIPKHWEVKRLKNIADIKYGLGQPPEEKEDGLPLIRATNVERGKINDKDLIFVDPEDVPYDRDPVLKENDIIVVRSGAYTADSAIIPKKYEGSIAGYDMVVRVNKSFPLFISFCLLSNYLLVNQLFLERLRAAQPHLNKEELSKSLILIPSLHEQVQIANYLQDRTESIDKLLNNIDTQIEKLQELRKIKIYEAVTGKIKVNAYAEETA